MRVSMSINKSSLGPVINKISSRQNIIVPFNLFMTTIGIFINFVKIRGAGVKSKEKQTN